MITKTPGVCGGRACIEGTRMPVWVLTKMWRRGIADAAILEAYPDMTPEQLKEAWTYTVIHPAEIDRDIEENVGHLQRHNVAAFLRRTIDEGRRILDAFENDGEWYLELTLAMRHAAAALSAGSPDGNVVPGDQLEKLRRG